MATQSNFKVKNGLDVGNSLTVDSNATISGTLTFGGKTFTTLVDSSAVSSLIDSGFSVKTTDNLSEGNTNLYYTAVRTDSDARNAISVTDNGGDGSLVYTASSGVITYTGPSATEVRAHFAGGTGVTYDSSTGQISIGQSVGTGDTVTFSGLTVSGDLTVTGTTTTVTSQTLKVNDPLLHLADSNETSDVVDIGFVGHYYDGSFKQHTGLFRDATNSEYYLFGTYRDPALDSDVGTNVIDRADSSFGLTTLNLNSLKFSDATEQTTAGASPGFAIAMAIAL